MRMNLTRNASQIETAVAFQYIVNYACPVNSISHISLHAKIYSSVIAQYGVRNPDHLLLKVYIRNLTQNNY